MSVITGDKKFSRESENSEYKKMLADRYASFDSVNGKEFENGNLDFTAPAEIVATQCELILKSGKQELFENLTNRCI